jgi:hypothetical protein
MENVVLPQNVVVLIMRHLVIITIQKLKLIIVIGILVLVNQLKIVQILVILYFVDFKIRDVSGVVYSINA